MTSVIGYVRVSTELQVEGFGLTVQSDAITRYCTDHDLSLVSIARDEGISGSNGLDTRVGLGEALVAIERGEAQGLVVYRLDRLARDLLLQETLIGRIKGVGASVYSVTEPDVDSDTHTRVLVRQVLGAISQYERAVIRARVAAGKAAKAAQGGFLGGTVPWGYRLHNGTLVADEREQEAAAFIRSRVGTKSLRAIGGELVAAGYLPRSGGEWHPNSVRQIAVRTAAASLCTPPPCTTAQS